MPDVRILVSLAGVAIVAIVLIVVRGGGASAKPYTLSSTEHCLFSSTAQVSYSEADADFIGLAAPGGGVGVTLPHNRVTLGFERNASDARDDLRGAALFGVSTGPKLHDDRNVYVSWDNTPTAAETQTVEGCLGVTVTSRIPKR